VIQLIKYLQGNTSKESNRLFQTEYI